MAPQHAHRAVHITPRPGQRPRRTSSAGMAAPTQRQQQHAAAAQSQALRPTTPWFSLADVPKRLGRPFAHPGGPAVVSGATASKRLKVGAFHDEAAAALAQLSAAVDAGLADLQAQPNAASAAQSAAGAALAPQQQQQQQQQQQYDAVDASDLRVPIILHRDACMVVPPQQHQLSSPAQLHAWLEAAAAAAAGLHPTSVPEPGRQASAAAVLASAPGAAAAAAGGGPQQPLQPGEEVLLTLTVYEPGSDVRAAMQELQVLSSCSLADLRDAIRCPTDALAAGLGTSSSAAYLFINGAFYDDTRAAPAAECSAPLQRWAAAAGLERPRLLYQPVEEGEDEQLQQPAQVQQAQQQQGQQQQQQQEQQGQEPSQQQHQHAQEAQAQAQEQQQMQQHQQQAEQVQQQVPPNGQRQQQEDPQQQQQQQQQQQHPPPPPPDQQQQQAGGAPGRQPPQAMHATRLRDLTLQASNRPMALYCHQGCCEHALLVSDVRLLHASDPAARAAYPRTVWRAPLHRRFACNLCKRQGATVLLLHHPHAPEDVVMLCGRCDGLFEVDGHDGARKVSLDQGM